MDVRVAGHQVDTGESLREHAQRRVAEITEKYFSRSVGANVTFGKGPNNDYTCDIVAPVVQGMVLRLRTARARRRWRSTAPPTASKSSSAATPIASRSIRSRTTPRRSSKTPATRSFRAAARSGEQGDNPAIVAETRIDIPESSVSDAVMLMDLRNTNALMFKNSGTGEFNMIYRREDGNIGWVEPHTA